MGSRRSFVALGLRLVPLAPTILSSCYYNKWVEVAPVPKIKLIYPIGGEILKEGEPLLIQWESENVKTIDISFSFDNGVSWVKFFSSIPSSKTEQAIVLNQFGEKCLIKLVSSDNPEVYYILKSTFQHKATIEDPDPDPDPDPEPEPEPDPEPDPDPDPDPEPNKPFLVINTNLDGATVLGGDTIGLQWYSESIEKLKLEYSTDGGLVWNQIATNYLANLSSMDWGIPQIASTNCIIRISDLNSILTVVSKSFTIQKTYEVQISDYPALNNSGGSILLSMPNLGEAVILNTGTSFKILSTVCTHSGCGTTFDGSVFNCSCHGSQFDSEGNVLRGPAGSPLNAFRFKYLNQRNKLLIY